MSRIIFIGASTGGTEALREVLSRVPADGPPILAVQHMPASFTGAFAKRLDSVCPPHVIEAAGGEKVLPGHVYIAPGSAHMRIRQSTSGWVTELDSGGVFNRHMPSVDVLFESAAERLGAHAVGVLLTGMGKDGALGLLHMHAAGAATIAQDEASCVVYGMPREAARLGAVDEVLPIGQIAARMLMLARAG